MLSAAVTALKTNITKLSFTAVTAGLFGVYEAANQTFGFLAKKFADVRVAGSVFVQGLVLLFNGLQLAWESLKAAFTDDTIEQAFERAARRAKEINESFRLQRQDFAESNSAYIESTEAATDATNKTALAMGDAAQASSIFKVSADDIAKELKKIEITGGLSLIHI